MDPFKLNIFQAEVSKQVYFALRAVGDIRGAVNGIFADPSISTTDDVFYHVQAFLTATANVSKLLWAQKEGSYRRRRQPLRDSFAVDKTSPLYRRDMRNHYEHFDERIEVWWDGSLGNRIFIDFGVVPRTMYAGAVLQDRHIMRHLDPVSATLYFGGDVIDLISITAELERLQKYRLPGRT